MRFRGVPLNRPEALSDIMEERGTKVRLRGVPLNQSEAQSDIMEERRGAGECRLGFMCYSLVLVFALADGLQWLF